MSTDLRSTVKRVLRVLFLGLALPFWASFRLLSAIGNRDAVFYAHTQLLSLLPGTIGVWLRGAFLRLSTPDTDQDIAVCFGAILSHVDTTIERGVYVGPQCNVGSCRIGRGTLLGSGVHVLSGSNQHSFADPDRPIQEQEGAYRKVRIGADCWLGNGAIVMNDVGDRGIVAAGSVVVHPVEPGTIVAGNPARPVRQRDPSG